MSEKNKHIYDVDLFDLDLLEIKQLILKIDNISSDFKHSITKIIELRKNEIKYDSIVHNSDPLFEFALSLYLYSNQTSKSFDFP